MLGIFQRDFIRDNVILSRTKVFIVIAHARKIGGHVQVDADGPMV